MYIGTTPTKNVETGDTEIDQVVRGRTLGEAIDKALMVSMRRGGAVISINAREESTIPHEKVLLSVQANACRGIAIVSYCAEMPDRAPVDAAVDAVAAAAVDEVA